jgi:hypothetical protein
MNPTRGQQPALVSHSCVYGAVVRHESDSQAPACALRPSQMCMAAVSGVNLAHEKAVQNRPTSASAALLAVVTRKADGTRRR